MSDWAENPQNPSWAERRRQDSGEEHGDEHSLELLLFFCSLLWSTTKYVGWNSALVSEQVIWGHLQIFGVGGIFSKLVLEAYKWGLFSGFVTIYYSFLQHRQLNRFFFTAFVLNLHLSVFFSWSLHFGSCPAFPNYCSLVSWQARSWLARWTSWNSCSLISWLFSCWILKD